MSPRSKLEYVEAVFLRYKRSSRKAKTRILDEFCATCGYHRKYAIQLLRGFKRFAKPKKKKRGRRPAYRKEDILKPLKRIWLGANLPYSKRLKAILGYDNDSFILGPFACFRPSHQKQLSCNILIS